MKPGWRFLNSKEAKNLKKRLNEQFEFSGTLDYAFLQNEKNKVYIVSRDIEKIDFEKLRINSIGVYFAKVKDEGVRLSIEGSQLIGPYSDKDVIKVDESRKKLWLKGNDLDFKGETKGFVILKSGKDFIGCAKHKNGKLLNYVPKERRIKSSD